MADKRISQLVDRGTVANNDVVPIVVSGAVTTNKATISSIQTFMQGNLDFGVTSVGITLGSSGTDVNVTGSPITTSGNITINFPTASATNRGLLSSADWTTFNSKQPAGNYVTLDTSQTITAQKTFTTSGSSDTMIISHGSGSGFALDVIKAGNNEAIRVTKTSGSGNAMTISGGNFEAGTIVKTGGLSTQFLKADGSVDASTYLTTSAASSTYVTLATAQTISGAKTFTAGLVGTTGVFSGALTSSTSLNVVTETNTDTNILLSRNLGANGFGVLRVADGGNLELRNGTTGLNVTTKMTINSSSGLVILTGALQGTSASFSAGVALTSDGGTNQLTTLQNTSAVHSGSGGSNRFGFNGNNNIYFSKGLDNGGIIAWNNSAARTYTLPDTSGTLALTTDLGAYLPLTGGTLTGALNGTSAAFNGSVVTEGLVVDGANNANISQFAMTRTDSSWGIFNETDLRIYNSTSNTITPTSLRFVITTGGNLGIGVTPSAWGAFKPSLQVGTASLSQIANRLYLTANGYFNGSTWNYIDTDFSSQYFQQNGEHIFATAPSGTANNAITYTPRLTIASTGAATFSSSVQAGANVLVPAGSGLAWVGDQSRIMTPEDNTFGALIQTPGGIRFNAGGTTPRMTILADGNVVIGTASLSSSFVLDVHSQNLTFNSRLYQPSSNTAAYCSLFVSGAMTSATGYFGIGGSTTGNASFRDAVVVGSQSNNPLVFNTNDTERMRITSGGDVLLGSPNIDPIAFRQTGFAYGNSFGLRLRNPETVMNVQVAATSGINIQFWTDNGSNVPAGSISSVGGVTSYNMTSDYRLKEDLQEVNGIEKVQAIKVYDYQWKGSETRMDGVLAHELAEVLPYAVYGEKDAIDEEGNDKMQGVDYSKIVPILIKAIQEQQEQIDSLKNQMQ